MKMSPDERRFLRNSREIRRDALINDLKDEINEVVSKRMPDIVELIIGREMDHSADDDQTYFSTYSLTAMKVLGQVLSDMYHPAISFEDEWYGVR